MKNQKESKQPNKIQIVKNKDIIIYKNGEEFKRFRQTETKELKENEMYILDFILKKYSSFEMTPRNSKLENIMNELELESNDNEDFFKKRKSKNMSEEDEDRKTEPKLREFFKDVEEEKIEEDLEKEMGKEEMLEKKKIRKGKKTIEEIKVPIKRSNNNANYHYEEENVNMGEKEEEEESEESPQYIIEMESYTSPTIKNVDKKRAEDEILNGIRSSNMITGEEKEGIIFLGKNETLVFVSFEDKKETIINLNNLKRIYFNIRGSINLRNYKKKSDLERFIQFVELNNKKTDFKFNNDSELEYLIIGILQTYKHRDEPIDKNVIMNKMSKYFNQYYGKKKEKKAFENKKEIEVNHENIDNFENEDYVDYNQNYEDNYNGENNEDDGEFITSTKTEVFKNGKLINEETQEEYQGVVRTVHSYSPDIDEYEEYLRKSKFRKSNVHDKDLNRSLERVNVAKDSK